MCVCVRLCVRACVCAFYFEEAPAIHGTLSDSTARVKTRFLCEGVLFEGVLFKEVLLEKEESRRELTKVKQFQFFFAVSVFFES